MAVSLETLKKHVRAEDFTDDDVLLGGYLAAARQAVITATCRTEAELTEMGALSDSSLTQLEVAILSLAGHWYNTRENVAAVGMHEVPYTYQAMIKPFRKLVNSEDTEG